MIDLTLKDLIWLGSLLITVVLSYGKIQSDIRHLKDIKADRRELDQLSKEIRAMIAEVRMDIARLAETVRYSGDRQRSK